MHQMARYNRRCEIRLSEADYQVLAQKAAISGLSMSAFLRKTITTCIIKEAAPVDIPQLIWEIHRVGNNINQILVLANSKGFLDVQDLRKAIVELREVEKMIAKEYSR
jgi:hypothetical protein